MSDTEARLNDLPLNNLPLQEASFEAGPYFYADGTPVLEGDEVLMNEGSTPALVVAFVSVEGADGQPAEHGVMVEDPEGEWIVWDHAVSEELRFVARKSVSSPGSV